MSEERRFAIFDPETGQMAHDRWWGTLAEARAAVHVLLSPEPRHKRLWVVPASRLDAYGQPLDEIDRSDAVYEVNAPEARKPRGNAREGRKGGEMTTYIPSYWFNLNILRQGSREWGRLSEAGHDLIASWLHGSLLLFSHKFLTEKATPSQIETLHECFGKGMMICDSGAHSVDSGAHERPLDRERYIRDMNGYMDHGLIHMFHKTGLAPFPGIFNQDLIGDPEASFKAWVELGEGGLWTVPVFHRPHSDLVDGTARRAEIALKWELVKRYLCETLSRGHYYIGLGGMTTDSNAKKVAFFNQVYRFLESMGVKPEHVYVHGLATVAYEVIRSFPIDSVDSSGVARQGNSALIFLPPGPYNRVFKSFSVSTRRTGAPLLSNGDGEPQGTGKTQEDQDRVFDAISKDIEGQVWIREIRLRGWDPRDFIDGPNGARYFERNMWNIGVAGENVRHASEERLRHGHKICTQSGLFDLD